MTFTLKVGGICIKERGIYTVSEIIIHLLFYVFMSEIITQAMY